MNNKEIFNKYKLSYFIFRLTMGLNLLGHGMARLFKINDFRNWLVTIFAKSFLPSILVSTFGTILPIIEFSVGMLLILGLWTRFAVIMGAIQIAILVFGSCLIENWEWAGGQMIYAIFYFLLALYIEHNAIALDTKIYKQKH